LTLTPIANIVAAHLPVDAVGIVVHDCHSPGHDDIVANDQASITNEMASSDERTASYPDLAANFLEINVGMNDRIFAD
jgi:hypothetical protein